MVEEMKSWDPVKFWEDKYLDLLEDYYCIAQKPPEGYLINTLVTEFLPIKDDLERALVHIKDNEGLQIILDKFKRTLEKHNITEIVPQFGEKFNTDYHTALGVVNSDIHEPNTIASVVRKGYLHNNKVVRYSEVIVFKKEKENE